MLVAVVPAYNEAKNIGSVVRDLFGQVDKVIVVDDGSWDQTAARAREAGATVLRHCLNRGQGAALETGHELARRWRADWVVDFDADGQFQATDIPGAWKKIKETGTNLLLGSRFLGANTNLPWKKRYLLLPLARWFHHLFLGLSLTDAHNGFRLYTAAALEKIRITQDRMAHASEIPAQARHYNLEICEYPVTVKYQEYGQGLKGAGEILKDIFFDLFVSKK